MQYSNLTDYILESPNCTTGRTLNSKKYTVDTITIHCMAGNASIESCGKRFQDTTIKASSNYGIGSDGRVGCYVYEENRSWCSSNSANDVRAITIEVANTVAEDPWPISDEAYNKLILLLVDICKRHKIKKLIWSTSKEDRVNHRNGCNMTCHRDYAAKACPGNFIYNREGQIAEAVNKLLGGDLDMTIDEFINQLTPEQALKISNKAREAKRKLPESSFASESLQWAKEQGIMNGDESGNMMPRDDLTREQFVTVLHRYDEKHNK